MADPKRNKRRLKICCAVVAIVVAIKVAVMVTLFFTVFKLKDPIITVQPTGLNNLTFSFVNIPTNVTVGFLITVKNRNYGSFTFYNATSNVDFHGMSVGEVPIEKRRVPARGQIEITTSGHLMVKKMITSPSFFGDFQAGSLNMTSSATLPGKVSFLKVFKFGATAFSTCDISVFIKSKDVVSKCLSKIKL